eukprot:TRINITY_DN6645_c0_g1_i1.p1 TRINITY_DN6645_c0_g1~~TRINITY_DN6645_c0_g1_i1.p1  ORF type:complete len:575 (-),score=177.19 TRINITY_DN6645_c0_g1_i1:36-1739(-)
MRLHSCFTVVLMLSLLGIVLTSPLTAQRVNDDVQRVMESDIEDQMAHADVDVGEENEVSATGEIADFDDSDSDVEDEGGMSLDRDLVIIHALNVEAVEDSDDNENATPAVSSRQLATAKGLVGKARLRQVTEEGIKPLQRFVSMTEKAEKFVQKAKKLRLMMETAVNTVGGKSRKARKALRAHRRFVRALDGFQQRALKGIKKLVNHPIGYVHTFGKHKLEIVKKRAEKARKAIEEFHEISKEDVEDFDQSFFDSIWDAGSDLIDGASRFASEQWNRAVSGLAGLRASVLRTLKSFGQAIVDRVGAVLQGLGNVAKAVGRGIGWIKGQINSVLLKFGDFIERHVTPRLCRGVTGMFGAKAWSFLKRNAGTILGIALAATGALVMPVLVGAVGISSGLLISTTLWSSIGGCLGSVMGELIADPENASGAALGGVLGAIPGGKIAFKLGSLFGKVLGPTAVKVVAGSLGGESLKTIVGNIVPSIVGTMFGKAATQSSIRALAKNSISSITKSVKNAAVDTGLVTAISNPSDFISGLGKLFQKKERDNTSTASACPVPPRPPVRKSSFWG